MNTKFWGPGAWRFLHTITFNYPVKPTSEQQFFYRQLFTNFGYTLPCKYCRDSYRQFLRELPLENYLHTRKALVYWLYMVHNKVNNKLRSQGNKVPPDPTFEQVCNYYEKQRADCGGKGMTCSISKK